MADKEGHIFWDLPPYLSYPSGYEMGCTVYIANLTDEDKEYGLIARIYRDDVLLLESGMTISGNMWFPVEAGDFIRLNGSLKFDETNVVVVLNLIDRDTEEVVDFASSMLFSPSEAELPPPWPTTPIPATSLLSLFMMMIMMVMMTKAIESPEEKGEKEEKPALSQGRS